MTDSMQLPNLEDPNNDQENSKTDRKIRLKQGGIDINNRSESQGLLRKNSVTSRNRQTRELSVNGTNKWSNYDTLERPQSRNRKNSALIRRNSKSIPKLRPEGSNDLSANKNLDKAEHDYQHHNNFLKTDSAKNINGKIPIVAPLNQPMKIQPKIMGMTERIHKKSEQGQVISGSMGTGGSEIIPGGNLYGGLELEGLVKFIDKYDKSSDKAQFFQNMNDNKISEIVLNIDSEIDKQKYTILRFENFKKLAVKFLRPKNSTPMAENYHKAFGYSDNSQIDKNKKQEILKKKRLSLITDDIPDIGISDVSNPLDKSKNTLNSKLGGNLASIIQPEQPIANATPQRDSKSIERKIRVKEINNVFSVHSPNPHVMRNKAGDLQKIDGNDADDFNKNQNIGEIGKLFAGDSSGGLKLSSNQLGGGHHHIAKNTGRFDSPRGVNSNIADLSANNTNTGKIQLSENFHIKGGDGKKTYKCIFFQNHF